MQMRAWDARWMRGMAFAWAVHACAACASVPEPPKLPVMPGPEQAALPSVQSRVAGLHVRTTPDMNERMALMLDVVFVRDRKLVAKLPKTASAWFAQREALQLKYAGFVDVIRLELVLSDDTGPLQLSKWQRKADRVLMYANYLSPQGQTRADISTFRCPQLLAAETGVVISEGPHHHPWWEEVDQAWLQGAAWEVGDDVIACGR